MFWNTSSLFATSGTCGIIMFLRMHMTDCATVHVFPDFPRQYSSCFVIALHLDKDVHCLDFLMSKCIYADRTCVYEALQKLGWGCLNWTTILLYIPMCCFWCGLYLLSFFVRFCLTLTLLFNVFWIIALWSFISKLVGWLVVLGLTALWDSLSVYFGPFPKERDKEKRKDRRE